MNKYLTKIAQISTLTLQRVHGDSSVPGTPGMEGVPVPKLPDLTKKAFQFKSEHAKDLQDTAVIGGLGGLTGMASHRILSGLKNKPNNKLVFGISTGMGLAADYAGLKINKALESFHNKKETNVPL